MAKGEIHVGDVGTIYDVPLFDDDISEVNFNPSGAATKEIFFDMPGQPALISRTALAVQRDINGTLTWCLTYTVVASDMSAGFHQEAGKISLQGKLTYAGGVQFSTSIVSKDLNGRELRVYKNLEA